MGCCGLRRWLQGAGCVGGGGGGADPVFVVTALANLAAGYNLAVAGHVLFLIEAAGHTVASESETSGVASAAFIGAVTGQLVMGYTGERIGVVRGLVITFLVLILGCMLGAFACWAPLLLEKLAATRFVVGFGAGGVYPLAAIASAGSGGQGPNEPAFNGRRVILTFSFQGVGQLCAPLWVLVLDWMFSESPEVAWRVAVLSGAIPAAFGVGHSLRLLRHLEVDERHGIARVGLSAMDEEERDMRLAVDVDSQAETTTTQHQPPSFRERWTRDNLVKLVGTGGTWFLFDVMFYGNIVFTPFVIELVFGDDARKVAGLSTVVGAIAVPALVLASCFSDRMGRKRMQLLGFSMLALLFSILAIVLHVDGSQHPGLVFTLYCATFFFYNFGPNATTFCLPAETFDAPVRSFFNGVSAAMGKMGAIVGAALFKGLLDSTSLGAVMGCSAGISLLSLAVTQVFVRGSRHRKHQHQQLRTNSTPVTEVELATVPGHQNGDVYHQIGASASDDQVANI
ncbi:Probable inorganic phosphate transporter 1-6 (AtPht1 [Durusdinium trenchii]|uniref:Probable inorganic phosphate transporter 1-6 (AtPht1) n=1 Tax=Durusdinium trenchii TaxID=1381693 RepID=A0ABP0MYC1_9DINO